ncbi:hypothetical protein KDA_35450 [Dictyobacter alpinus]|uniref:HAMP domain-containing protein n=2 Tax=Dictyobacter alpinus TaxID=2014873 RepID=A0A402B9K7_9CHLR|nr:hypothetical protein KDA_35450 [Dictyobacter alpinus]
MLLNRSNKLTLAGILIVVSISMTPITNILTTPEGLSLSTLPLFDLLVISLVICASVLPGYYVFLFASLNSAFIAWGILAMPHKADLTAALQTSGPGLVSLPIAIQFVTAFVAFIWVQSASKAIVRADRAEQIAQLEHDIAESRQQVAQQKVQLDAAIQEITHALLSSNNERNFSRISTQGNPLWTIIGPINNILARMERMRHSEHEYQQISMELEQLLEAVRVARRSNQPLRPPAYGNSARLGILYQEIASLQARDNRLKNSGLLSPYDRG